jgi:hypothetical protein
MRRVGEATSVVRHPALHPGECGQRFSCCDDCGLAFLGHKVGWNLAQYYTRGGGESSNHNRSIG